MKLQKYIQIFFFYNGPARKWLLLLPAMTYSPEDKNNAHSLVNSKNTFFYFLFC